MTPEVKNWIASARGKYIPTPPGRILEIGALDVNGRVRDLFPDAEVYIGVDNIAGRNVDVVLNGHDVLSQKPFDREGIYDHWESTQEDRDATDWVCRPS